MRHHFAVRSALLISSATYLLLMNLMSAGCLTSASKEESRMLASDSLYPWQTVYDGFGQILFEPGGGIVLVPKSAGSPDLTHAALLLGREPRYPLSRDLRVTVVVTNESQLRSGSPPNPWECFWLFFNSKFDDSGHIRANYFIFKTNGVELGRAFDHVQQAFLATRETPRMSLGERNTIQLTKIGQRVEVKIDGNPALEYVADPAVGLTSSQGLFDESGSIGLYTEDARVRVHSVEVERLDNVSL